LDDSSGNRRGWSTAPRNRRREVSFRDGFMTGANLPLVAQAEGEPGLSRHGRRARRALKNVSRNRPDATNLNHQYANRRVFISPLLQCNIVAVAVAPLTAIECELLHIMTGEFKFLRDAAASLMWA
jgi:hypothetical protein